MSRDKNRHPRKNPARKSTPDGMEQRSENIGDAGRGEFNLRTDQRDSVPGRSSPRDAPVSVRVNISRHNQAQAQKFSEHAAKPIETQSENLNSDIPAPVAQDKYSTEYRTAFDDGGGIRSKPNTVYRRRADEQRQGKSNEAQPPDTAGSQLSDSIPQSKTVSDRSAGDGGERLKHDSSYRQLFDEQKPEKLQTDHSRLSEMPSQNARASDRSGEDSTAAQKKRGSADYRRFNEQPQDGREKTQPQESEGIPRNAEMLDSVTTGERLNHDSPYRQQIEERHPERLQTDHSRLSEMASRNVRSSDSSAGNSAASQMKPGSAYQQRKFNELRAGNPDSPQNELAGDSVQKPSDPVKDIERQTSESLAEEQSPERDTPLSHERTPHSTPERPERLLHDREPMAPKEATRRKPISADAAKSAPTGESKPESKSTPVVKTDTPAPDVTEDIKPERDTPLSHERTQRSTPERPERLRHDRKTDDPKDTQRNKKTSPDAAKNTTGDKKPDSGDAPAAQDTPAVTEDKPTPADDSGEKKAKPEPERGSERSRADKPGKLKFSENEAAPSKDGLSGKKPDSQPQPGKKLKKAQHKAERSAGKLEKARDKLPKKKRVKIERTFDEKANKPKRKLVFEDEVKSQHAHMSGPLVTRPIKAGVRNVGRFAHSKVFQVEHENVAVKAAHRGEMLVESGLRTAYRMHKTAPYRKVEKLQARTTKLNIKASYQKALNDNPKLKSNIFSRMAQKRKIKKQYAKAAQDAKKAGKTIKKTGDIIGRAGQAVVRFVTHNPKLIAIIGAFFLLFVLISSLLTTCSNMGSGIGSAISAMSYLAQDADVDNTELSYTEWETDLQLQIGRTESDYPDYDEYRYNIGDISHNPYELMAFLTAVYQEFTFSGVESVLRQLFAEQYQLTFTPSIETRYTTGDNPQPYDWRIMTVTLTSRPFTEIIYPRMNTEQRQHYDLLMRSRGGRQYSASPFDFNWTPYVTSYYGYRIHPVTGVKDYHKGIDIAVPVGTDVRAGHDGTVTVGYDAGGYGHYITLTGTDGLVTKYAHLDSVLVSNNQTVKAGDVIAKSGNSGNSTGPHLHFEVIKNGQYLNPAYFSMTNYNGGGPVYGTPGLPMGDGSYDALIAEAESHIGRPYVWGGSSPSTSFDCSGFVSWCLTQSGVMNTGRLTAQGLYNICTPITSIQAQPGDLIFFTGTYSSANPVTHVGIYVGGGLMLHAGDPIGYTSINTSYWQSHLYAFGRLNQ